MTAIAQQFSGLDRRPDLLPFALAVGLTMAAALGITNLSAALLQIEGTNYVSPALGTLVFAVAFIAWPHATLLGFALMQLFIDVLGVQLGPAVRNMDELVVPAFLLIALVRYRPWQTGRIHLGREAAVAVLIAAGVVSSLLAGVPLRIWALALLLLLKGVLFFYLVSWMPFSERHLRHFAAVVLGVAGVVLFFGLVELLDPEAFRQFFGVRELSEGQRGTLAVRSLLNHPGLFGWFLMFCALFAYAAFIVLRRWSFLALALLLSFGSFLSGRRKPLVGLPIALVIGLLWHLRRGIARRELVRVWSPIAAGVFVLAVVFAPQLERMVAVTVQRYFTDTALQTQARGVLYLGSFEIGQDYFPLGAGLGRYGSWMARVEYSPLYHEYGLSTVWGLSPQDPRFATDTFWPMILGETGVVGLVALAAFFALIVLMLWRTARSAQAPVIAAFCLGTLFIFFEALAESIATSPLTGPRQYALVLGAAGVVAALAYQRGTSADERADQPAPEDSASAR